MKPRNTFRNLLLVAFFFASIPTFLHAQCTADSLELVKLYNATGGGIWSPWDLSKPMKEWFGVDLDDNGCVTIIADYFAKDGTFPSLNLPKLKLLEIYGGLHGQVPPLNLPSLENLLIEGTKLSGALPTINAPLLTTYKVLGNNFDSLPISWNYPALQLIDISNNKLTQANFTLNLPKLLSLLLSKNKIAGAIPDFQSSDLPMLRNMWLNGNSFQGIIPTFNLPSLTFLDLSNNSLDNDYSKISLNKTITTLYLRNGKVNKNIQTLNLENLELLDLSYNDFKSGLPTLNNNLQKLKQLVISNSNAYGEIPDYSFPLLTYFDFKKNNLSGHIPNVIKNIPTSFNGVNIDIRNNKYTFSPLLKSATEFPAVFKALYVGLQQKILKDTTIYAEINDSIYLNLGIDDSLKTNKYAWYKDNKYNNFISLDSNKLILKNLKFNSFGTYFCKISNSKVSGLIETANITITSKNQLHGTLYLDSLQNCQRDTSERGLKQWKLKYTSPEGDVLYSTTDSLGQFSLPIAGAGAYKLEVITPNPYWKPCQAIYTINATGLDSIALDLGVQKAIVCPRMRVNVTAPVLRPGFVGNYEVRYCNEGTATAQNAYVILDFDPFLSIESAAVPFSSLGNNRFRFELGTVLEEKCATFWVQTRLSATAPLGAAHCVEAHIYPDVVCNPSEATLQISGGCDGTKATFSIENTNPTKPVSGLAIVKIIEDNLVLLIKNETTTTLNPKDTLQQALKAGSIYTFQATLPNGTLLSRTQHCPNLVDTKAIATQYAQNDGNPFTHRVCRRNQGSYDPNEKLPLPTGRGPKHFIERNEDLEYTIHFQNTGTDTAFNIVVRDTLDAALDPSTLEMGASSHPYTWDLSGSGNLTVSFPNILLPDTLTNMTASQGYFSYKIKQKHNNLAGTSIKNRAGIYFDFNAPIITNQTFHTITKPIFYTNQVKIICFGATPPKNDTFQFAMYDSIVLYKVVVIPNIKSSRSARLCFGEKIQIGSQFFDSTGVYTIKFQSSYGCDSIVTLNLTVLPKSIPSAQTRIICVNKPPYSMLIYTDTLINMQGCDSLVTIHAKLTPSDTTNTVAITYPIAGFYTFNNKVYYLKKDTVLYIENLETLTPCDFTRYLITIKPNATTDLNNDIQLLVAPNPFDEKTIFFLQKSPYSEHELLLFDHLGRLRRQVTFEQSRYTLERSDLLEGVYFYQIRHDKRVLKQGKVVIF